MAHSRRKETAIALEEMAAARSGNEDDLMDTDALAIAQWQFRVAWSLADQVQLPRLTDQMCWWLPAAASWTVRKGTDNGWHADWSEPEPVNSAPPTIGWLTWHLLWWWGDALAVVDGCPQAERSSVRWPGSAASAVGQLRALSSRWTATVAALSAAEPEQTDQLSLE